MIGPEREPAMNERAAFISAILDSPDDDTPRLVFADWLQEHGEEPRAEFIRAQIEAAKLPEEKRATSKAGKRAEALRAKHGVAWCKAIGVDEYEGEYVRGFLTGLEAYPQRFAAQAAAILALEPAAFTLNLEAARDDDEDKQIPMKEVEQLATNPHLRAVVKLESQSGYWGPKRFARLMRSPHLANLKVVTLFDDAIGVDGIRALVEAAAPFRLEELDLNGGIQNRKKKETAVAVEAAKLIAGAPRFSGLKELTLWFNGLGAKSMRVLLDSQTLPRTMKLNFEEYEYDALEFAEQLAKRFVIVSDGEPEDEDDD